MRRALFGGSFDPPHRGHVAIVDALLARDLAERVVVVPARLSPLKTTTHAPATDRLAMLRLALAGRPDVEIWTSELTRPGPSYTVDTLRLAASRWPRDELLLVLGADAWAQLPRWREPREIRRLARLLVVPREGRSLQDVSAGEVLADFDVPVSSREVRRSLARGILPEADLPAAVAAYIRQRGLYGLAAGGEDG